MSRGTLYAFSAYLLWGFFPIFWKQIDTIPAIEIIGHRLIWTPLFLWGILVVRRHWDWMLEVARKPKVLALFAFSGILLSANWLAFIWAVNNGYIIEASLGYFINPLVNVMLGVVILRESLNRQQKIAIGIAEYSNGAIVAAFDERYACASE